MPRKRSKLDLERHDVVEPEGMQVMSQRVPKDVMRDVLYAARVAASQIRKISDKTAQDPNKLWGSLTTHQKVKIQLDVLTTLFAQPEILEPFIEDLMTDRNARQGAFRAMLQTMPRELNLEVTNKTGVMLVPAKADNIDKWLEEAGVKTVDGEVLE